MLNLNVQGDILVPKNKEFYSINISFGLVLLFVISTFLLSTNNALKITSINASAIVSILMLVVFLFKGLVRGKFIITRHHLQVTLLLLLLWVALSLLISKVGLSKTIPAEAYSYSWATGLNSPAWRGVSFLSRVFLTIFAIEFIISNVNTIKKFFLVVNITILFYSFICFFGFLQIILFGLFKFQLGSIIVTPGYANFFRIGGYVGEPQTFGLILISGYFLLLSTAQKQYEGVWFSRSFLKSIFLLSTIVLIFTFSVSMIVSVLITAVIVIFTGGYWRKKRTILVIAICIMTFLTFYNIFNERIITKLTHELSTINERTITWLIGWETIKSNLLTGIGIGQAPFVNSLYITDTISKGFKSLLFFNVYRQPPMNSYIEFVAETGLIGAIILVYLFYGLYKLWIKITISDNNFNRFVKYGYGMTLLALAIAANSSSGNFYTGLFALNFSMYIVGNKFIKRDYPILKRG